MDHAEAVVGIADHAGWAAAVTVSREWSVIDRRRLQLVEAGLPAMPHHHEAQGLPLDEAEALVERVRASAQACAKASLNTISATVSVPIVAITLRACPPLPTSVAERISDYRAQCVADSVMYRTALAHAAASNGWSVRWYDPKRVFSEAARVLELDRSQVGGFLQARGAPLGPPWQKDHRTAMAAAIVVLDEDG